MPPKKKTNKKAEASVSTPATSPTTPTTTPATIRAATPEISPTTSPAIKPAVSPATTPTRVTRSATRRGDVSLHRAVDNPEPRKKKKAEAATIRTVIIEYSKQPTSFKTKAVEVKSGLEKKLPEVSAVLNSEKPGMGCFEIREEGGQIFREFAGYGKALYAIEGTGRAEGNCRHY